MRSPRSARSGYTLIELLLAMSIGTVLMGILAVTMARVMFSNTAVGEQLQSTANLGRLGEQFRRDVHAATSAQVERDGEGVRRLKLATKGGEVIEYEICDAGLNRIAHRDDVVPARDQFALAGMRVLDWNDDSAATGQVTLDVGRMIHHGELEPTVATRFAITAGLGRDQKIGGGL